MSGLDRAITGLEQALAHPRPEPMWRRLLRHRVGRVHAALLTDELSPVDAWLAARVATLRRERETLLQRLDRARTQLSTGGDAGLLAAELHRLAGDLRRHVRHLNDLAYDTVALELGGSE